MFRVVILLLFLCCSASADEKPIHFGIQQLKPYQSKNIHNEFDGLDIAIAQAVAKIAGMHLIMDEITWGKNIDGIKSGSVDAAFGATYTRERAAFSYFSLPYRFEENSIFVLKQNANKVEFTDIQDLINEIRLNKFRLGVVRGFEYVDNKLNALIQAYNSRDSITAFETTQECVDSLVVGDIDGFISDTLVASNIIFNSNLARSIVKKTLHNKVPIHFMFSKQSMSDVTVDKFNTYLKELVLSKEYKKILADFCYPIFVIDIIHSQWFYLAGMLGCVASSIVAIMLSYIKRLKLFDALCMGIFPVIIPSIIRDISINSQSNKMVLNPEYFYATIFLVCLGSLVLRIMHATASSNIIEDFLKRHLIKIKAYADILCQCSFMLVGVTVAAIYHLDPVEFWAGIFGILSGHLGCVMRDYFLINTQAQGLQSSSEGIFVSTSCAVAFGVLLNFYSSNPEFDITAQSMILMFCTSILARVVLRIYSFKQLSFV